MAEINLSCMVSWIESRYNFFSGGLEVLISYEGFYFGLPNSTSDIISITFHFRVSCALTFEALLFTFISLVCTGGTRYALAHYPEYWWRCCYDYHLHFEIRTLGVNGDWRKLDYLELHGPEEVY